MEMQIKTQMVEIMKEQQARIENIKIEIPAPVLPPPKDESSSTI